ncbi:hypothetical protein, partial [Paracoccus sp. S4493]|uniref:hypothetical protein n=1 Tax=Paracoccus sp. S4493 TaxID=579490 RepID=UPI00195258A3
IIRDRTARLLGSTLENCGFNIVKTSKGEITDTHQVLCESHNIFNADEITKRLASNGILCNANHLPRTNGFTSEEGIRFGTQEVTWQGMQPTQAVDVGHLIHDILASPNEGPSYRHRVKNLRHSFKKNILSNVG